MKFFLLTLLLSFSVTAEETEYHKETGRTFVKSNYEGWNVFVNKDVLKNKNWPKAKILITYQLMKLKVKLNDSVIKAMQKIPIYVDIKQEKKGGAEYHPSKAWLVANGFSPKKARCVEISGIAEFIEYDEDMPWILLHELMHAYHHQVLTFEHKEILKCFTEARKKKKYNKTLFIDGRQRTHYASSNHKEYFAEAAEAYFGVNDYFPFVRAEILKYDPQICKVLSKLAKSNKKTVKTGK